MSSSAGERVLAVLSVAVVCLVIWRALEGVGSGRGRLRGGGAATMGVAGSRLWTRKAQRWGDSDNGGSNRSSASLDCDSAQ
jgi:hypothetical protein